MAQQSEFEVLFKSKGRDVEDLKQRTKSHVKLHQERHREKLLISKRFKVDDLEEAEEVLSAEEEHEKVESATKLLKQGKRLEALTRLHKCFARRADNADVFIRNEGLQSLQSCFLLSDSEVLHAAAWCAINLSAGDHSTTQKMMRFSPLLLQFLQGSDVIMQELCAWAVGNLAGDSHSSRETLLQQGCVPHLLNLVSSKHHLTLEARSQSVLFALINLAKDENYACIKCMQENQVYPHIVTMLQETSVTCDLCFEIGWLTNCIYARQETFSQYNDQYETVLHHVIVNLSKIVMLKKDNVYRDKMMLPYILCAGNIVGQSPDLAMAASDYISFLPAVFACLQCNVEIIQQETLWLLANLTAEPSCRVLVMCQPRFLTLILKLCHDWRLNISLNALYLVEAAAKVSSQISGYLVNHGVIKEMTALLSQGEEKRQEAALDILTDLVYGTPQGKSELVNTGGRTVLQSLSSVSVSDDVKHKAKSLLDLIS